MKTLLKLLMFFGVNIAGSFSGFAAYLLHMSQTGALATIDPGLYQASLMRIMITWVICAVFSFTFFFLKSAWRFVFLLMPIIIPVAFGFYQSMSLM